MKNKKNLFEELVTNLTINFMNADEGLLSEETAYPLPGRLAVAGLSSAAALSEYGLLSGMALHRFPDRPECAHLLHCLTRYLAAPTRPAAPLAPEALRRLVAEV